MGLADKWRTISSRVQSTGRRLSRDEDVIEDAQQCSCKICGKLIAFIRSTRTGRLYPVNVTGERSNAGSLIIHKADFHKCEDTRK